MYFIIYPLCYYLLYALPTKAYIPANVLRLLAPLFSVPGQTASCEGRHIMHISVLTHHKS